MTTFGLFVDFRRLDSSGRSAAAHGARTLELLAGAEALGCDAAWFTEHHGFADGYLPQPLVLAAAVAARTTNLRLGTAVVLAPLRHPRHIAEEAALVDVISSGRVELGLGAGYAQAEYDAFDVDMARRFDRTDSVALEVRRLLGSGDVTPGPVQRPLPLWLGYQGPKGAHRAGRAGMGLLSLDRALFEPYRQGLAAGGHDPGDARMGGLVDILVADDPPAAAERLLPHWLHQQNTYRALMRRPDGSRPSPLDEDKVRQRLAATGRLGALQVLDVAGAVAELRRRLDGLPAHHVFAWLSLADMPDDLVERHVELWCGPVREAVRNSGGDTDATGPAARLES
ncbi:LLM class flavin-dependent oxidoreductase [Frankia nepalensis]|uniref:LLM class flavin-dependent oxidoreductase n=1 Tax=Frankia nepalensis TaxID=1836974 RepID=A0A937UMR4_9ACTN|nr:LLM class flavin-dependent oxidoreductase [Frankia nepalensis]MBL7627328.1 LLM class flavin-dependent oxidoreductase [Frankia nepalensis]